MAARQVPAEVRPALPTDSTLMIEFAGTQTYDAETQIVECRGGVVAHYGPTTLRAETLILNYQTKQGEATGEVVLEDPEGTLWTKNLKFDWGKGTGTAEDVVIKGAGMNGRVARVEISPEKWTLFGVYGSPSGRRTPDIALRSARIVLSPGRRGVMQSPQIILFGKPLPKLPTSTFSLDKRVEGLRIPAISFRRKSGLGVTWSSGFLLGENLALSAAYSAFPSTLPTAEVALTRSSVPPSKATGFITPRTELAERANSGYMNNIVVQHPADEDNQLRSELQNLTVLSSWNLGTSARLSDQSSVSKAWELSAEHGGGVAGFGAFAQARVHQIRESSETPWRVRSIVNGTLQTPVVKIGKVAELRLRADALATAGGGDGGFGWIRGEAGVSFRPQRYVRLGAAYVRGKEYGSPLFLMDRLYSREALHVRGDLLLGNIWVSSLMKYDVKRSHWYDTEFGFSFVAGSFEPYITTRLFPRETRIGFRLRIDLLMGKLTSRSQKRPSSRDGAKSKSRE